MYKIVHLTFYFHAALLIFRNIWTRPWDLGKFISYELQLKNDQSSVQLCQLCQSDSVKSNCRQWCSQCQVKLQAEQLQDQFFIFLFKSMKWLFEEKNEGSLNENYLATSSIVAGIGLSFVSESNNMWIYSNISFAFLLKFLSNSLPGRMNVMRPEVMAMEPKMRVGMMGLISARAATVVDRVPPTCN